MRQSVRWILLSMMGQALAAGAAAAPETERSPAVLWSYDTKG